MTAQHSAAPRFRLSPMRPRDPGEEGRAASTLELFFDLVFVIAVSIASSHLHDTITEGRLGDGVVNYLVVFFGIWWAWMNFTWFATSFDTDDWLYRVLTIVQMGGVLILAAGIGPVYENEDYRLLIGGYVLMRIIMISQWLRASRGAGAARWTTIIYAAGIGLAQILWVMWLAIDDSMIRSVGLVVLILAEVAVPVIAEARGKTPWHPHHITERYGCFTIIVLGESLLASANTVFDALGEVEDIVPLISLGVLCLIVTAAMWWIYFWPPHHRAIGSLGGSLRYGYGHYFIFAAAGAFSAGVGVEADSQLGASALNPVPATFTVSVPIVVFVLGVWVVAIRANANAVVNTVVPACALLVLLDPIIPVPTFLTTFFMVIIVITLVVFPPLDDNGRTGAEAVVR